jgi:hypothetical protein
VTFADVQDALDATTKLRESDRSMYFESHGMDYERVKLYFNKVNKMEDILLDTTTFRYSQALTHVDTASYISQFRVYFHIAFTVVAIFLTILMTNDRDKN